MHSTISDKIDKLQNQSEVIPKIKPRSSRLPATSVTHVDHQYSPKLDVGKYYFTNLARGFQRMDEDLKVCPEEGNLKPIIFQRGKSVIITLRT